MTPVHQDTEPRGGRKKNQKEGFNTCSTSEGVMLAIYCKLRTTFYNTTAVVSGGRASSKERCISEFGLSYAAITVMPHSPRLVGDRGFEQGNCPIPSYRGNLFHQISTTQKCKCAITILYIKQMPFPKGMVLGSNPLHNPHPPQERIRTGD